MTDQIKDIVKDYLETTIYKSWTWEMLTPQEKADFEDKIKVDLDNNRFSGTKDQVKGQVCMAYYDFLLSTTGGNPQKGFR